jgi:SAM-dependent methyltransferase
VRSLIRLLPLAVGKYGARVTESHVLVNRAGWDADADNWVEPGRKAWASDKITWGAWSVPESDLPVLPDVDGLDVVELGCGTAYWSAWLARRGARPVGLDNSSRQLATAKALQAEFDLRFPLVHADAERAPFNDESFDLAFSEYGAAIWCDPYRWIPEAARVLRPGGWLIFLGGHPLALLCYPKDDDSAPVEFTLHRDYFGMHRTEWHDEDGKVDGVEFRLPHGEMIRLLRSSGFEIQDLVEIQVPDGATTIHDDIATPEWISRYPPEQIWKARKR